MDKNSLSEFVSELIGMPLWKISIGPCGMNIEFGKKIEDRYGDLTILKGEISLWVQCNTLIVEKSKEGFKEILLSYFPQETEEETIYKKYFEGKKVTKASVRMEESLHIRFDSDVMLVAYPWTKESEKCWIIYDHRIENPPGIVVYTDGIELAV